MTDTDEIAGLFAAIRHDLAVATDGLMTDAEAGLRDLALARAGDGEALSRVEGRLLGVLEACALEDLIGQRLTRLQVAVAGARTEAGGHEDDALLNRPAEPGRGLDQAEADLWLEASNLTEAD